MGNIFVIFQRVFPFVFFIILQIFCFFIISAYSDYHRSNIIVRSNYISAAFNEKITNASSFLNLPAQNEYLADENAKLKSIILNTQSSLSDSYSDSLLALQKPDVPSNISVFGAKVVSNSISNLRNYIIVNKGSMDGIEKDMSAISRSGPIGIVVDVSENYSAIMSVLNKDGNISVRVRTSHHIGQLSWKGNDIRHMSLEEIPKHIKLKKGEIIETSGYSSYYPEGLPVGKVSEYKDESKNNFANVTVSLFNDFSKVKYVYLIKNENQREILSLQDSISKIQNKLSDD